VAEAEDLVQETLIYAWEERSAFNPSKGSLKAWLCALMRSWWWAEVDLRRLRRP
jgi:DNA-directed RNA polymerase specialized sigma24 family protein